jgi:O-antigen ligase
MISLAIVFGAMMYHFLGKQVKSRSWLLVGVIWLAFFQHLLAVRSGLLTFYALGIAGVGWALWRQEFRRAITLVVVLTLLPAISYLCFPTFRNRFYNTQDDMNHVSHVGSANNYSLVGRVYSWKITQMITAEHPLLGVGVGDMESVMATKYRQSFPDISPYAYIKPHNQFLYWLVAFGGIGALVLTLGFYFPLIRTWRRHAPLLLSQYLILTLSFLVEYTLETQVGLLFALLFILLSLGGLLRPATTTLDDAGDWYPV